MNYPIHVYDQQSAGRPALCIGVGNGFPPGMYAPLARALGADYQRVCLLPRPWWEAQVPDNFGDWQVLADDLTAGIRQHELGPVIGIGHSMSGTAMVMAAAQNPDLFRALVLVDPVILPRIVYWLYPLFRLVGYNIKSSLIRGALNRRREWPSVEEATARFRRRSVFSACSDELVRLYAEGITRPKSDGEGIELVYPPHWEAAIYRRSPAFNAWKLIPRLRVPATVIVGEKSDTFLPPVARLMRRMRPDIPVVKVPGAGHLVPFEAPEAVAGHARTFLAEIG